MHPCNFKTGTAVGFPLPAGNACPAVVIGYDGESISRIESQNITTDKFTCKLMTQDAGITEERLRPFKCMEIRTANAYLPDPDDSMPRFS
jgi:streptogramin lyase